MKMRRIFNFFLVIFFSVKLVTAVAQRELPSIEGSVTIVDTFHYSKAFADTRKYRIFFPPGYKVNSSKKYPVIYFFHGWAQRYFGEMGLGYSHYDKGNDNNGDNMEAFVKKRDVIIVKVDGSNQFPNEDLNLGPWNIGTVGTFRQFPTYFEELVRHVDDIYPTMPDRHHRAVSGLSMGGFMSFWVSGKYPHLVSGAGNFCGSPEFKIGPYGFPVEYNHMQLYDNYEGVDVRMHYGAKDKLRFYHQDLNKIWPQVIDNYEYQIYEGEHTTCGMGDMFESLYQRFVNPNPDPDNWHHIDVYPSFEIWGYEVTSDRVRPGFTVLENVNKRGFRSAVRNFLPRGELMSEVNLNIKTPPIYDINGKYSVSDFNIRTGDHKMYAITSDSEGAITITMDGNEHHIGINELTDEPNISIVSMSTENVEWLRSGKDVDLSVELLNKGQSIARDLILELSASRNVVKVKKSNNSIEQINPGEVELKKNAFTIHISSDTIEIIRLYLTIKDQTGSTWTEHYDFRVRNDEDNLDGELIIADGKVLTVVSEAVDSVTETIGVGNGDGIANPGESIVLLIKNGGKLYRTNAFTTDECINPNGINMQTSDSWQEHEHIGASAKFTTPVISSECPNGRELNFWIEYWVPKFPAHIFKRGVVKLTVRGISDETAPVFKWLQIKNDKKIEIATYDASEVSQVKVRMIPDEEASTIRHVRWDKPEGFEMQLSDDGMDGDNFGGDSVFSGIIRNKASYVYRAEITITDINDNISVLSYPKPIFIQDLQ